MYLRKVDENGRPINEAIETFLRVDVLPNSVGEKNVAIPSGSFGFAVKRCSVDCEIKINDGDFIPLDEGDYFTPILKLEKVTLKVQETSSENIVFMFIK